MALKDSFRINLKGRGLPSRPDQGLRSKSSPEQTQNNAVIPERPAPAPALEKPLPSTQLPSPPMSPTMAVPGSFSQISPIRRGQELSPKEFSPVEFSPKELPPSPRAPAGIMTSQDDDDGASLEDFIPEPEENSGESIDAAITTAPAKEGMNGINSNDNLPPPPQQLEPVAAPLSKVHFACYQSHRSMPVANNYWYSVPCMTCRKVDQQSRYRCTFCCLRICGDCFQGLQKCNDRSLAEFLDTRPTA
ncbi:hypothetical protein DTO164E3_6767 [Paecilomyces variotii]|uniref:Uncharacterized protein n=1 Tax=Byssochlamys spectabilis TaxID=264951 RepID=A0A443HZI2_BYSSP|nr:hypothetical protein C8Q69DRAFT_443617 [Paecilomyces variotii]KAJ9195454.1 hypothetical protein DTO164E3_6767 [Paecilomyces variotii]KAJ9207429.1 hypothetical protein DTO032I3_1073 [Paecilomyces variotii]KAJ9275570.1 hypothetical protein DTO021D3_7508 [Paecilomyces variotii]KAJ9283169.1 hypothetical protein DTO021C3_9243 [Paecilomyces variotii]KAJ9318049.1 hypothetical protein DTO271D3_1754 [Paecilomyces variotii]